MNLYVISLVIFIVIVFYKYKQKNTKINLTIYEINNIVSENIRNKDFLKYDSIFTNEIIQKEIYDETFLETVTRKMGHRDVNSFVDVHVFLKNNSSFIKSQKSRFNVPSYDLLATKIIVPFFTDAIIRQLTHYSEYVSLGSVFTFYNSGIKNVKTKINEIFDAFHLMMRFSNRPVKIKCHILFTDLKKRSHPGELVGLSKNINSGMTFGNTIIIWREEESVKVFVHEMVHLLNLDMGNLGNKTLKKILDSMKLELSDDSISSLGESYTETVAKIVYSIHKSQSGVSGFYEELKKQIEWSMSQCAKILFLNGISELGNKKQIIHQHTYMIEYYVLHAFFMHNISLSKDISMYINFFKQNENKENPSELAENLSNLDVSLFIKDINEILKKIPDDFPSISRSLKMSF